MDGTNKVVAYAVAVLAGGAIAYLIYDYNRMHTFEERIPTAGGGINNPGNIEKPQGRSTFRGEIVEDNDSRFTSFKSMAYCYRAIKRILKTKYSRGLKTLRDMIADYAPADDGNNVDAYVSWVATAANVNADRDMNEYGDAVWEDVIKAIGVFEQGQTWLAQYGSQNSEWVHDGFQLT